MVRWGRGRPGRELKRTEAGGVATQRAAAAGIRKGGRGGTHMLTMTEAASRKLAEIMSKQAEPVAGLRVFVEKGGCSGFSYGMSLATEVGAGDWVGEFGGVKVLVD